MDRIRTKTTEGIIVLLNYCTLTGVDEKTSFDWIEEISERYPFVEWGVLFSLTAEDKDERYGSMSFIERFAQNNWKKPINSALHVCGKAVNHFVTGTNDVREIASFFGRVQLNFNLSRAPFNIEQLDDAIGSFHRSVITQHNEDNVDVTRLVSAKNHQVLFDASGGRGIRNTVWPERVNEKIYGYAGGFGPETVNEDLDGAHFSANGEPYWIDMETKLRHLGHLSEDKCERVLDIVSTKLAQLYKKRTMIYHND